MTKSARALSANLAAEHRKRDRDPDRIAELREQHFEVKVTEWVERQLASAPPLSQATRDRLAALLTSSLETAPANRDEAANVVAA
jgi:hypothetical protein